ncbi:MAG: hypothetical protein AAGC64_02760 [Bacteroidota bacterium]
MFIEARDLAEAIGVKYETLRKHITRKKLFRSGKFIDTEFAPNKDYILDQTDGKGLDLSKLSNKSSDKRKEVTNASPNVENEQGDSLEPEFGPENSLSLEKKRAEIEKIKCETEVKKKQLERMRGELMPVELMGKIMTVNFQSVFREFESQGEIIATMFCQSMGGNSAQLTKMTEEFRKCIQRAVDRAKHDSAIQIKKVIKDYVSEINRG